ncbi:TonB-dependent receptor plug domain-containing protein [Pontixanthobacter sp.]|uniref:TonB-dependent receptor plug domain-containing protein n=1 Tax=Pontixanthobacter sp. TaxID=2792078 RepID=UPI003C7C6CCC
MKLIKIQLLAGACLAGLGFAAQPALAQDAANVDEGVEETSVITVLGSRREARSAIDSPVPIDVVQASELMNQGSSDIIDALTTVVPSLSANREPISDAATLVRPVNLRALPSDHTLVLVNGKRRHRGAVVGEFVSGVNRGAQGVDINPLFGASLEQVDVLRDGAAAQYGSDAIAGVINYQLLSDPDARNIDVQISQSYEGDGRILEASGAFGASIGDGGFATVALQFRDQEATSRGVQDGEGSNGGAAGLAAAGFPVADPVVVWGQPEVENDFKAAFNMEIPVGDAAVYSFATYAMRDVDGSFFYRNPTNRAGVFANDGNVLFADLTGEGGCPTGPLPTTSFADATAFVDGAPANCFAFFSNFPGGFTPRFGGTVNDSALFVGFKGEVGGNLTYDVSGGYGRNKVDYQIRNTVNASLGPNTPTNFNAGFQAQTELVFNADFTYGVDLGFASDLNIAFGAQYQDEQFEIGEGDRESYIAGPFAAQGFSVGSNGFQGFSDRVAGKFSRDSIGFYVDAEADITDSLLLSGAVRFEDFSDFGSTFNGKGSFLFRLSDSFALRGSASTGFRAPTLGQSNLQRASTGFSGGQLVEQLVIASTDPIAVFFGGGQLDAESATNFSLGTTVELGPVTITADYFNIKVEDRVALTSRDISAADRAALVGQGIASAATVSNVQFFVNDFDTRTSGVDIVANMPVFWLGGKTNFTLAYNYTDTKVTNRGTTISAGREREIEDALPANRATFTAAHTAGAFDGLIRLNYFGEAYESLFNDDTLPVVTPSLLVVDAEIGVTVAEHFRLAVGAKNLFDAYPDEWQIGNFTGRTPGFLGAIYPLNHPAGFNGGSYYLRISTDF